MKPADPFPKLLHDFFYEWMVQQRNASVHTVRSYRDTWRLFLRFIAHRRPQTVAQLTLTDLNALQVSAFLRKDGTPTGCVRPQYVARFRSTAQVLDRTQKFRRVGRRESHDLGRRTSK
jgi:site-specific recombinase XerD